MDLVCLEQKRSKTTTLGHAYSTNIQPLLRAKGVDFVFFFSDYFPVLLIICKDNQGMTQVVSILLLRWAYLPLDTLLILISLLTTTTVYRITADLTKLCLWLLPLCPEMMLIGPVILCSFARWIPLMIDMESRNSLYPARLK